MMYKQHSFGHLSEQFLAWCRSRQLSIQIVFIGFLLIATLITATVAISLQYVFTRSLVNESTLIQYEATASETQRYLNELDERATAATRILAEFVRYDKNGKLTKESKYLFSEAMLRNPLLHSAYIGFDNGELYILINPDADPATRQKLNVDPNDRWVEIEVRGKGKQRQRVMRFLDAEFNVRETRQHADNYVTKHRKWFANAKYGEVHKTFAYMFEQLQVAGETYSTRTQSGKAVIAIDMTNSSISAYLKQQKTASHSTEIYLYKENGELISSNQPEPTIYSLPQAPKLTLTEQQKVLVEKTPHIMVSGEMDWPPINFTAAGKPYGYSVDVLKYIEQMTGIEVHYANGFNWKQLAEIYLNDELDVLQPVLYDPNRLLFGHLSGPFLDVEFAVVTRKGDALNHINALKDKIVAIPDGWLLATKLEEQFPELTVVRVPTVRDMFYAVRDGKADVGIDIEPILKHIANQYFIDDLVVSSPLDFGEVEMPKQLHFMLNKPRAELAELFNVALSKLTAEHHQALQAKWMGDLQDNIAELGLVPYKELRKLAHQGGTNGLIRTDINGVNHYTYVVPFQRNHNSHQYLAIITPSSDLMAAGHQKIKHAITISVVALILLLPIVWYLSGLLFSPIRQLAVDSKNIAHRDYDKVGHVKSNITELHDLAVSMDEMADSIQAHEKAQKDLLDAFIRVIAQAIDDKSPHTANHCERVPELAFMLAKAANHADDGVFKDFAFETNEEWREFQVAAWLHDCGKITTPEHIIDKGTKLEVIYNRIHEVRMRFEVLWRDAEIEYLTACLEPDADKAHLLAEKNCQQQQLTDDFAFIAKTNIGGEFMHEDDLFRLQKLAEITWMRHFDDSLGLSRSEQARLNPSVVNLPVVEKLLADKAEHVIEREHDVAFDPEFSIDMDVPEHLYNMGELHNLSVARGTLSPEDRFKINEHIISTIKMLSTLPFPDELSNVPRYASTHHETLIGTGYPRKLTGDDLSMPERLMVLADVFEAVTAADRPYKKANKVSEAIAILASMVEQQYVDKDVFELFLRSGIYTDYAQRFLNEDQIDEVDLSQYLPS